MSHLSVVRRVALAILLALAATALWVSPAMAATLKSDYRFHFQDDLADSTGQSGDLAEIDGPGAFEAGARMGRRSATSTACSS